MSQLGPMLGALAAISNDLSDADAEAVTRYLRRVTEVFERYAAEVPEDT